jgi:hypothetical protein
MSSTILSSLGEAILHRNSLATITDNWIVVRAAKSRSQILVSIDRIAAIKTFKTTQVHYLACGLGCLVLALASICSKEADKATLPFALAGVALLIGAQITRQASIALLVDADTIQTAYGTWREAATLLAAIRAARRNRQRGDQTAYDFFSWVRAYIVMLVLNLLV